MFRFETSTGFEFTVTVTTDDAVNVEVGVASLISNSINNVTGVMNFEQFSYILEFGECQRYKFL